LEFIIALAAAEFLVMRKSQLNNYDWINTENLAALVNQKVILFGAGKGSEEFFDFVEDENLEINVTAITDNDISLWGKSLLNTPIIPPADLSAVNWDKIVVTSVSGRGPISMQLEEMGFSKEKDYLLVGRYPSKAKENFAKLCEALPYKYFFAGKDCLHIGPGGNLEFESILNQRTANVTSIDKYSFGMRDAPGIPHGINYLFPVDVEALPMDDNSEDWRSLSKRKFYQKRLMPCQWRDLAKQQGLTIQRYGVLNHHAITNEMKASFHSDFQEYSLEQLEAVDCLLVASK